MVHLCVIRIDLQRPLVLIYCLGSSSFLKQGVTYAEICDGWLDFRSLLKQVHRFWNPVSLVQDVAKVNLCHPATGITRNSCPVQCLDLGVHPALLPGQDEQYSAEHEGD